MYAASIGRRSQSARTYLEKNLESFGEVDLDQLIRHAIRAIKETLETDSPKMDEGVSSEFIKFNDTF